MTCSAVIHGLNLLRMYQIQMYAAPSGDDQHPKPYAGAIVNIGRR